MAAQGVDPSVGQGLRAASQRAHCLPHFLDVQLERPEYNQVPGLEPLPHTLATDSPLGDHADAGA